MNAQTAADEAKIAELRAIVEAVRERARARYPEGAAEGAGIQIAPADLMPAVHARDAAQAKVAAIGAVNPRPPGAVNGAIQAFKKTLARALGWFVRDQIVFNREAVAVAEALMEALNDQNRAILSLASQTNEQISALRSEIESRLRELSMQGASRAADQASAVRALASRVESVTKELPAIAETRSELERGSAQMLDSVLHLREAFDSRVNQLEANFHELVRVQHSDFAGALENAGHEIQQMLGADFRRVRQEYEQLIHAELRVIRQRGGAMTPQPPASPEHSQTHSGPDFDYRRFSERFRGSEEYVRGRQKFYRPLFAGSKCVLDIGCGRGEFLELMREAGVIARGIELSAEDVAYCRSKGLEAEQADLFEMLAAHTGAFDGIFCSQVVEHLAPERLPKMIELCAAALPRGGVIAIETPNPECLAIFATHFYLDPTHQRPVPHPLLAFYLEEAGFGAIEVKQLSPAVESFPELSELPAGVRERFFGGLDYAITARRL